MRSKIFVVPIGIDNSLKTLNPKNPGVNTSKKFKFLHVSSAFPRKGVDVLLNAYSQEFTDEDDTTLIIKTFPNPHNDTNEILRKIKSKTPNCPQVIHINRDLKPEEITWLYKNSDCLVYPTRGEGFGLPIAEAMYFNIPVIATEFGGHMDFCNAKNSFGVKYTIEHSDTHLRKQYHLQNSFWAEPNLEDLKTKMRYIYENRNSKSVRDIVLNAYNTAKKLKWSNTADKIHAALKFVSGEDRIRIGVVGTWNERCGIAEYSRYLINNFSHGFETYILANYIDDYQKLRKDQENVFRCWVKYKDDLEKLYNSIEKLDPKLVIFEFSPSFFEINKLLGLVNKLKIRNIRTILAFHSIPDEEVLGKGISFSNYSEEFKVFDRILVHTKFDLEHLKKLGLGDITTLLPLGIKRFENIPKAVARDGIFSNSKIISSFGFMLPHKGILEIIRAMPHIKKKYPDTLFLSVNALYPLDISKEYLEKCTKTVTELGLENDVFFFTDFISEDEIQTLLQASDVILLPYKLSKESSSAAVRMALAMSRPLIVTNSPIFAELKEEVYKISDSSPKTISEAVFRIFEDEKLSNLIIENAKKRVERDSWENVANLYENILIDTVFSSHA